MSRRILGAIVLTAALAVVAFGAPLALALERVYRDEAVVRLQRAVASAAAQIPDSFGTSADPVELPAVDDETKIGVYATNGRRLVGSGPTQGGKDVARAAAGHIVLRTQNVLLLTVPLISDEKAFGVIRGEMATSDVSTRARHAWVLMGVLGLSVVGGAALLGRALSRRIARPVANLAAATVRLGQGDFTARAGHSGIAELDSAADNLDATAERLGRLMDRERSFSADASHQLRTPLTGLRLHLETALSSTSVDATAAMTIALGEVDRLEQTIDGLLSLARDIGPPTGPLSLDEVMSELERSWHGRLAAAGRPLRIACDAQSAAPRASARAVSQVLDVLVDNAAKYGSGAVNVRAHAVAGGLAIDVSDEGAGITGDPERVFTRRTTSSVGHGIGLALARSLAEAEGGRLVLVNPGRSPTFRLLLGTSEHPS